MKNVTFTYDTKQDGEIGEACMTIMVNDERAAQIDAAFHNPEALSKTKVLIFKDQAERFCDACECFRGREYVGGSIKCVEVEEV